MEFRLKKETREMFLNFIGEPKDSPRRLDEDSPIHQDYTMKSHDGNFLTHVVLLDNRYDFNKTSRDRLGE